MHTDHTTNAPRTETALDKSYKCCTNPKCKRAGQMLPLSEFNKRKASPDGHQYVCRECRIMQLAQYRTTEHGKTIRAKYQRVYRKSASGLTTDRKGKRKYRQTKKGKLNDAQRRQRDKNKMKARYAVNRAIARGNMPRPEALPCNRCGCVAKEYHHFLGYSSEHHLDVIPVCKPCHAQLDFDPSRRKYQ